MKNLEGKKKEKKITQKKEKIKIVLRLWPCHISHHIHFTIISIKLFSQK